MLEEWIQKIVHIKGSAFYNKHKHLGGWSIHLSSKKKAWNRVVTMSFGG